MHCNQSILKVPVNNEKLPFLHKTKATFWASELSVIPQEITKRLPRDYGDSLLNILYINVYLLILSLFSKLSP